MSNELAEEVLTLLREAQNMIPRDKGMFEPESEWHARADTALKRAELEA